MAKKIDTTGTEVTEYKALEIEPDGTIRATYGGWVPLGDADKINTFLEYFTRLPYTERRGATPTSRVVLLERVVQTRFAVING